MKTIIVDFDGTICEFRFPDLGEPMPGVREKLRELREMGFEVIIHSVRTSEIWGKAAAKEQHQLIVDYLKTYQIPYDGICLFSKPLAVAYIDDRGISFDGNWEETVEKVKKLLGSKEAEVRAAHDLYACEVRGVSKTNGSQ